MKLISRLSSWNCTDQQVFVRADLNVTLDNGHILSTRRLQAIQPTLDYLINQNAKIILASHIGRPNTKNSSLSTIHLIPWFEQHGYTINFCADIEMARNTTIDPGTILLLENLRFFSGEKDENIEFAKQLAQLADWYINDAFGTLHRTDTSVYLLALQFPRERRTIGFLVEKELAILNKLMNDSKHPVTIILGGGKVADKLPLIENMLSIADHILLCPAIVFTFLLAEGKPVGKSLVDTNSVSTAQSILIHARQEKTEITFPQDYLVAQENIDGPLSFVNVKNFPSNGIGISVGPKTLQLFKKIISNSRTIFFNGTIGFLDKPETLQGMKQILTYMASSKGISIVAGGDSIAVIDTFKLRGITYCLTGGGSTLTYLSGKPLPGLLPFLN